MKTDVEIQQALSVLELSVNALPAHAAARVVMHPQISALRWVLGISKDESFQTLVEGLQAGLETMKIRSGEERAKEYAKNLDRWCTDKARFKL